MQWLQDQLENMFIKLEDLLKVMHTRIIHRIFLVFIHIVGSYFCTGTVIIVMDVH